MATQAVVPDVQQPPRRRGKTAATKDKITALAIRGLTVQGVSLAPQTFNATPGWDKLTPEEQGNVATVGESLARVMLVNGACRLAIGEHLIKLQSLLEPKNYFSRFLKRNFNLSRRTAYRYIAAFNNAKGRLPEVVLKAAMARGMNILGESETKPLGTYTEAVAKMPPPENATMEQAETWLTQVDQVRRQAKKAPGSAATSVPEPTDPQTALKECYRFVASRFRALPQSGKTRTTWLKTLVGMELGMLGVSGPQTVAPQAPPDNFLVGRGRPRGTTTAGGVQ